MGTVIEHDPVMLFVGATLSAPDMAGAVGEALTGEFGEIEVETGLFAFDHTDYYEEEMGAGLTKKFFAFKKLIDPTRIVEAKLRTNRMEIELFSTQGPPPRRAANLDPGYLSLSHVVLATTKNHAHRVYLREGIYAEVTLHFHRGVFKPWEWTYPDYRSAEYIEFFHRLRSDYRRLLGAN